MYETCIDLKYTFICFLLAANIDKNLRALHMSGRFELHKSIFSQ